MAIDTELDWYGDKVIKNVNSGTIKALIRAGQIVKTDARLIVAKDTTNLMSSIVKQLHKSSLTETISTNSEYAFAQEFGRPDLKNYTFKPFMRPALKNNTKKIEKIFIDEERRAIDK